jgi:hypothetical protein
MSRQPADKAGPIHTDSPGDKAGLDSPAVNAGLDSFPDSAYLDSRTDNAGVESCRQCSLADNADQESFG